MYGVISIHNLPIADAVGQRAKSASSRRAGGGIGDHG
jgi:hypothetical protein